MALPVAHYSFAAGLTGCRTWTPCLAIGLISVAADFDLALVWGLNLPLQQFHRTFSHSIGFAVLASLLWKFWRPRQLEGIGARAFLIAWLSHIFIDLLCTLDRADHGLVLFWPISEQRWGWAVLVPLYQLVAETPFTLRGAAGFTLLEVVLAYPLWKTGSFLRPYLKAAAD